MKKQFSPDEVSRIIEMAWEDRTPFEVIKDQFGLSEKEVITLMRKELKSSSFKLWRQRVTARKTKHQKKSGIDLDRFHCKTQYKPKQK